MARNAETAPIRKVTRPDQTPKPRSSDLGSIPAQDTGHNLPNFPGFDPSPTVGGIPHAQKVENLVPAGSGGDALDIPGATRGERGL